VKSEEEKKKKQTNKHQQEIRRKKLRKTLETTQTSDSTYTHTTSPKYIKTEGEHLD